MKKAVLIIISLILMSVSVFLFFRQKNNQLNLDFAKSYKEFNIVMSDFSIPVFATNIKENQNLDKFNKIYSQIVDSMENTIPNFERLELSKQAILFNEYLIVDLNNTDNLEKKAGDILIVLNTKATTIKDKDIKDEAIQIADLCKKDLDNLIAYKRSIWDKRNITAKLLQKIIDNNGELAEFVDFLDQEDNQIKIQNQNKDLEKLSKNFNDLRSNHATAYARFRGLTGIID